MPIVLGQRVALQRNRRYWHSANANNRGSWSDQARDDIIGNEVRDGLRGAWSLGDTDRAPRAIRAAEAEVFQPRQTATHRTLILRPNGPLASWFARYNQTK